MSSWAPKGQFLFCKKHDVYVHRLNATRHQACGPLTPLPVGVKPFLPSATIPKQNPMTTQDTEPFDVFATIPESAWPSMTITANTNPELNTYQAIFDTAAYVNELSNNIIRQINEDIDGQVTARVIAALHPWLIKAGWTPPPPATNNTATEN